MLEVLKMTLGPLPNNVYVLGDDDSGDAVVIDPSFESQKVLARTGARGWTLRQIWLTHAHFDHIAGTTEIAQTFDPPLPVGLHPADLDWYHDLGGAGKFGMSIPPPPEPSLLFNHAQELGLQSDQPAVVEVRHAPGHSPGHVMFYCEQLAVLFCGDVIFREGIGRTDLKGGNQALLLKSIQEQVFSLPDNTRLLSGHGSDTTVGHEKAHNPFLL